MNLDIFNRYKELIKNVDEIKELIKKANGIYEIEKNIARYKRDYIILSHYPICMCKDYDDMFPTYLEYNYTKYLKHIIKFKIKQEKLKLKEMGGVKWIV